MCVSEVMVNTLIFVLRTHRGLGLVTLSRDWWSELRAFLDPATFLCQRGQSDLLHYIIRFSCVCVCVCHKNDNIHWECGILKGVLKQHNSGF